MKKSVLFILCFFAIGYSKLAAADSALSPYISAKFDAGQLYASNNFNDDPFNVGFIGAVGMQYKVTKEFSLRAELEASYHDFNSYRKTDDYPFLYFDNTYDYKSTSFLANFYVDRDLGWKLKPYGTVGFGLSNFKETVIKNTYIYITKTTDSEEQNRQAIAFAFAFGAGFSFNIIQNLQGDFGMRYMIVNDKISPTTLLSATVGIRYSF